MVGDVRDSVAMKNEIPANLRSWFVIHFWVDMAFAIPMMLFPVWFLELFGWQEVDPITTRIAASALLAIGIESLLSRNAGAEVFAGMLNLKIIWSTSVLVGIGYSLIEGAQGNPPLAWGVWLIFLLFNAVWIYWRMQLANKQY